MAAALAWDVDDAHEWYLACAVLTRMMVRSTRRVVLVVVTPPAPVPESALVALWQDMLGRLRREKRA